MGLKEKNQDVVKIFRKSAGPSQINKKIYYVSNQELTLIPYFFIFLNKYYKFLNTET